MTIERKVWLRPPTQSAQSMSCGMRAALHTSLMVFAKDVGDLVVLLKRAKAVRFQKLSAKLVYTTLGSSSLVALGVARVIDLDIVAFRIILTLLRLFAAAGRTLPKVSRTLSTASRASFASSHSAGTFVQDQREWL